MKTEKPWGYENLIAKNEHYALKEIVLLAGFRSSLQSHLRKTETVFVVSGQVTLERRTPGGEAVFETFRAGQSYDVQPGTIHRVRALRRARLIEASTPELDDVIRHEDDFGRV